jgi:hypothetical protein
MFPQGIFFGTRVSVCITVGVSVGGWVFLFATKLATEMGFTDDCYTDGSRPSVSPSVLFSPTDFIAVTDGINPSVKLDNVVVKERIYLKRGTIGGKNMWRWTCVGVINKAENSLT